MPSEANRIRNGLKALGFTVATRPGSNGQMWSVHGNGIAKNNLRLQEARELLDEWRKKKK